MKPFEALGGMPDRVNACERARVWLHEACDERRALDAEQHLASCASCQREAALAKELEQLLLSEPALEVPSELVPGVMKLVQADLARATRNARLAWAGAVAALVAFAVLASIFDVVSGATGLAHDAVALAESARAAATAAPELRVPTFDALSGGYVWGALGLALVIVIAEVRLLSKPRRASA
jgi:hypothetical protein